MAQRLFIVFSLFLALLQENILYAMEEEKPITSAGKAPKINVENFELRKDVTGLNVISELKDQGMTPSFRIRNVKEKDIGTLGQPGPVCLILNNPKVVERFAEGKARPFYITINLAQTRWLPRWAENDPRSLLVIENKKGTKLIGILELRKSAPGTSELRYFFNEDYWATPEQKNEYEYITLEWLVSVFCPALIERQFSFEESPLSKLLITVHTTNTASCHALEDAGFQACPGPLQDSKRLYVRKF